MSENKEYVSRSDELGNIHISEEVLAAISAAAALEVEGVSSLAANLGSDIAELLGKKNLAKGVRVKMEDDKVEVDLSVLIAYGHTIPDMGKAVQEGVKGAIESMTGLEVASVNVNVGGINLPAQGVSRKFPFRADRAAPGKNQNRDKTGRKAYAFLPIFLCSEVGCRAGRLRLSGSAWSGKGQQTFCAVRKAKTSSTRS